MQRDLSKLKFNILLAIIFLILITSLILHASGYNFLFYKNLKQMSTSPLFPLIYLLLYFISSFFPIPFLAFMGGAIFPLHEAFLLSMLGNIIFFIVMFYLTRWLGREYVNDYESKHTNIRKLASKFDKNSFLYVFIFRVFFIIPPEAINVLAGLSKMKFRDYIISSILGTIPVVLVSILLVESYRAKQFYLFIIALVLFALFIILPFLLVKELRKYFKKK
jgi:uncharacterized membrane protein YdjX (TVP38/TMEM64 family)